ncbi:hypothetical protein B5S32_g366 [[Candida] boidinii]|nr:hypothetical protein B5S32_g366 [[Candida] boidinii]
MAKPRLLNFDAFSKTVEDAKIKTASGGIVTIICIITVIFLIFNEYVDYCKIIIRPELVIDRDINEKLEINLDISFPNLPCDLVTMDIMDITGDTQLDLLSSGFTKIRLDSNGKEIESEKLLVNQDVKEIAISNDPNYCGSCYGALDQTKNEEKQQNEKICCNTCESVKLAYANMAWKFFDGENIEQCEKEGYVTKVRERLDEGCRIKGTGLINRIGGNIHFAPGESSMIMDRHIHDLSLFDKHSDKFNFAHTINHFSFGKDPHDNSRINLHDNTIDGSVTSTHPLDHKIAEGSNKYHIYTYFLKVISTRYEYLDSKDILETNQFSATEHNRPIIGGRDEDHPNTIHARGGLPGVFFNFEISPLKIINREQYAKTWSAFILGVFAVVGGVLSVGALLDKTIWAADRIIRQKKDM